MSFFVSGMHCAYNSHGLNFGVGFVEMSFFIATLFLRLSCDNGMENIRNRASPAPVKLQLVPTHLLEGRIKIKPRPHQEDPAPSLIHQCPHNLGLSYLNCSSDQGDPNPILGSCPRAKGRLLPLCHGPQWCPLSFNPGESRQTTAVAKVPVCSYTAMLPPLTPHLPPHPGQAEVTQLEGR